MNIPPKGKSTGRTPKYNFDRIEVGSSRYYSDRRARQASCNYMKRNGGKFIARVTGKGITIYRTE